MSLPGLEFSGASHKVLQRRKLTQPGWLQLQKWWSACLSAEGLSVSWCLLQPRTVVCS